jgi:hypothetical protein
MLGLTTLLPTAMARADNKPNAEFARKATWHAPSIQAVREQVDAWLATRALDATVRGQIEPLWTSAGEPDNAASLLDLVAATLALGDPQAQLLVAHCAGPRQAIALPDVGWLADDKTSPLARHNLRLLYGRWLIHEHLYDEAAEQLTTLKAEDVVDPASLLFYQAVVHQRTLQRDAGLAAIGRLLDNEAEVPKRFLSLARLMQADLEPLKDESLDHIARRMDDIRRRLDLGRAGPKVREVEDGVIASLDKLIKKMEDEQQAAAAAAAAAAGGGKQAAPSNPLPDSMPVEQKGPGQVAKKPIGDGSGWGQLPPKERQEALQQIGKDYPAHYRDMIEQYFRKLASEGSETAEK